MRDNLGLARSYRRLSDIWDEWLTPFLSIAVAVGVLNSVPSVMMVFSALLGSFTSFLIGICVGLGGSILILIAFWFLITKEYKRDSKWSTKPGAIPNPFPTKTDTYPSKEELLNRHAPPAQMSVKGEFSGIVWTSLTSEWDRHESLKDIDIQARRVKFWRAQLINGVMTLTPDPDKRNLKPVSLDLTGCSVRIVTECLGAKSYWWKKGPLEISHHERSLLEGENSFFLFAEHGGAKEQWYITLSRLDHDGDSVRLLQDMYGRYSVLCHQKRFATFPFSGALKSQEDSSSFSSNSRVQRRPRRNWMRRWWGQGKNVPQRAEVEAKLPPRYFSGDSHDSGNPFMEMERVWMTEGWATKNGSQDSANARRREWRKTRLNTQSGTPTREACAPQTPKKEGEMDALEQIAKAHREQCMYWYQLCWAEGMYMIASVWSVAGEEAAASLPESDVKSPTKSPASLLKQELSAGLPQVSVEMGPEQERCDLASPSPEPISINSTPYQAEARMPTSEANSSNSPDNAVNEGMNEEQAPKQPGTPIADSMDGIHGLNMFLARWAFDLARNPLFEEKLKERIQKKLTGLRRPNFVNPLTLVSADMGTNFPVISNFRSLPSPSKVIWPQLLMDISYSGGMELIIETTVDVNETWAWSALDKAINLVGGQDDNQDVEEDRFGGDADTSVDQGFPTEENRPEKKLIGILPLRKAFAGRAKKLVDRMADSISKIPLRLCIQVSKVEGQLLVWMSPPPSDRLWISFVEMPCLDLHAKPILANRVMKYSAQLGRVSAWLEKKLQTSFFTSLVFPNCTDGRFPGLLGLTGEWGLRHPGKNLLSELASVAASDGETEETQDRKVCPEKPPSQRSPANIENKESMRRHIHLEGKQRSRSNGQEPLATGPHSSRLVPIRSLSMGAGLDELLKDENDEDYICHGSGHSDDMYKSTRASEFLSYDDTEGASENQGSSPFALDVEGSMLQDEEIPSTEDNFQAFNSKAENHANRMKRVLGNKAASIRKAASDKYFLASHRTR